MGLQDHEFDIAPEGVLGLVVPFGAATEDRLRGLEDEVGAVAARLRNDMGTIAGQRDLNRAGMSHGVSGTGSISNGNAQDSRVGRGRIGRAGFGGFVIGGGFVGVGPDPIVDRGQGGGWAGDPGPLATRAATLLPELFERERNADLARGRAETSGNAAEARVASVLEAKVLEAQLAYYAALREWQAVAGVGSVPIKDKVYLPNPESDSGGGVSWLDLAWLQSWVGSHGGLTSPAIDSYGVAATRPRLFNLVDPAPESEDGGSSADAIPIKLSLLIDPSPDNL